MTDRLVSPLASGGAGHEFEYDVATLLLSRMLRGAHLPVGSELPVARIGLQQRNSGFRFDDIVAFADPAGTAASVQIQVKLGIRPTASDPDFIEVMQAAHAVCLDHTDEIANGSMKLALAAPGPVKGLTDLTTLTDMARAHVQHETYVELLRPLVTKAELRNRYDHVTEAVSRATGIRQEGAIDEAAHRILSALHIWQVDLGRDWRAELDGLTPVASGSGTTPADLLQHLRGLAGEFGPRGGVVDAGHLRVTLHDRFGIRLAEPGEEPRPPPGITVNNYGSAPSFVAGGDQNFHGGMSFNEQSK
ncbi:hypothetical protein GFY24_36270 [Nocardia sp. SYP-A9097]|uniref:hypothetical protein n=1 Tax=Nocardia sp. SYP-A9097 TaxID=2663237 RepID=UPI00129B43F5|nr:hypothetical protein [Nocardia sp. SYP-A9097]MRH92815.1 hypothetical protein [Nocardia sp. SYP-A9097]